VRRREVGLPVQPEVVDTIDDLTAEWLTGALRSVGHDVAVMGVSCTPIGTGQMGATYRLRYAATGDVENLPATFVVKLAAPDRAARAAVTRAYRAEIAFYREVAPTVDVNAPSCHLALLSDDQTALTLLLEDLAPAAPGDQVAGTDPAAVERAAVNLAGLHGPRWDDATLFRESWADDMDEAAANFIGELMTGALPNFVDRVGDRVSSIDLETLEAGARAMPAFLTRWQRHVAVLHGDYRLDNLLFAPDGSSVVAVDWQTLSVGLPTRDLAYLVATSLSTDDRRASERTILDAYRQRLARYGVECDEAELFDDYRAGLLQCPFITVIGAAFSARSERGDEMFAAMARRGCAAIRDLEAIELVSTA